MKQCIQYRIKTTQKFVRNIDTYRGSTWKRNTKCHLCQRQFRAKVDKDYHLLHHREMVYRCPEPCGYTFLYFRCLKRHSRESHKMCLSDMNEYQYRINQMQISTIKNKKAINDIQYGIKPDSSAKSSVESARDTNWERKNKLPLTGTQNRVKTLSSVHVPAVQKKVDEHGTAVTHHGMQCHLCHRKFQRVVNRKYQLENHNKMLYQCPDPCGNMFIDFELFRKHSRGCHGKQLTGIHKIQYRIKPDNPEDNGGKCTVDRSMRHKCLTNKLKSTSPVKNGLNSPTNTSLINELKCHLCQRRFISKENRKYHVKHHREMIFKCPDPCGYLFLDFKSLQDHVRNHNIRIRKEDKTRFIIQQCPPRERKKEMKNSEGNINEPRSTRSVQPQLDAPVQSFVESSSQPTTRSDMEKGDNANKRSLPKKVSTAESKDRPPRCDLCRRTFNSVKSRDLHKLVHKDMVYKWPIIQPLCGNLFLDFENLYDHCRVSHSITLKKMHEISYRLQKPRAVVEKRGGPRCGLCQRLFKTFANRDTHVKNHDQMKFRCPSGTCGFLYQDFRRLLLHCRDIHKLKLKEKDKIGCLMKDNEPSVSETLVETQIEMQKPINEKMPTCELCQKGFRTEKDRNLHLSHHDEFVYKCPGWRCYNLFVDLTSLRKHIASNHTFSLTRKQEKNSILGRKANCGTVLNEIWNVNSGAVVEKNGNFVGTVDVHTTEDGTVYPQIDSSTQSSVGGLKHPILDCIRETRTDSTISPKANCITQQDGTLQHLTDNTTQLPLDDTMQPLVDTTTQHCMTNTTQTFISTTMQAMVDGTTQHCVEDITQASVDGTIQHCLKDTTQPLFGSTTVAQNDTSGSAKEELNSTLNIINNLLDTKLLDEALDSSLTDAFVPTLGDAAHSENKPEPPPLKIDNCFSLSGTLNENNREQCDPPRYDLQTEHSFAFQSYLGESMDNACVNEVLNILSTRGPLQTVIDMTSNNTPEDDGVNTVSTNPSTLTSGRVGSGMDDYRPLNPPNACSVVPEVDSLSLKGSSHPVGINRIEMTTSPTHRGKDTESRYESYMRV